MQKPFAPMHATMPRQYYLQLLAIYFIHMSKTGIIKWITVKAPCCFQHKPSYTTASVVILMQAVLFIVLFPNTDGKAAVLFFALQISTSPLLSLNTLFRKWCNAMCGWCVLPFNALMSCLQPKFLTWLFSWSTQAHIQEEWQHQCLIASLALE